MFEFRFKEVVSSDQNVEQMRGIEGARVKKIYELLAKRYGVIWKGRNYDQTSWGSGDMANRCLSSATACLYGVTEAGILAAGYSSAIGFIHSGKPLSFVYDIADLFKFETVVPVAFQIAARNPINPESTVRRGCRDVFRETKLLAKIIPTIEEILTAGGIPSPEAASESIPPVILKERDFGINHRS